MKSVPLGTYRNVKNGNLYEVVGTSLNATNANEGQIMIHYRDMDNQAYVRDFDEFVEKFDAVR